MVSAPLYVDTDQIMSLSWSSPVVAVQLAHQLLADAQVGLLTRLLTQPLQLVDVAMALVLEREPGVRVELAQPPGLVGSTEDALDQGVAKPSNRFVIFRL